MKKLFFTIVALSLAANNVNAQLTVYSNGNVGVATSESTTPVSTFAVGEAWTGYGATVSKTQRGICGISNGQYLNWAYGVFGQSKTPAAPFQCGVSGIAYNSQSQDTGRTYGVKGLAGNATDGWNYGVFGQLNGTQDGAGVYGTATSGDNGTCVDGRYAGYFNGATKVIGNLTVTGSISGVILSPSASSTSSLVQASALREESPSPSDRLLTLNSTTYYLPVHQARNIASALSPDTASYVCTPSILETQIAERVHYGIEENQMEEAFPELVYRNEDGTTGINYIELIPVLVQTINELNARLQALEGGAIRKSPSSSRVESSSDESEGQLQAMNNPTAKEISISYSVPTNVQSAEICICDMSGKLIKSQKLPYLGKGNISISTDGLSSGIYIYSLIMDGKISATKRIMVSNL